MRETPARLSSPTRGEPRFGLLGQERHDRLAVDGVADRLDRKPRDVRRAARVLGSSRLGSRGGGRSRSRGRGRSRGRSRSRGRGRFGRRSLVQLRSVRRRSRSALHARRTARRIASTANHMAGVPAAVALLLEPTMAELLMAAMAGRARRARVAARRASVAVAARATAATVAAVATLLEELREETTVTLVAARNRAGAAIRNDDARITTVPANRTHRDQKDRAEH